MGIGIVRLLLCSYFVLFCFALMIPAECQTIGPASADQPKKIQGKEAEALSANIESWAPPPPMVKDWDWIQHKSGEWLKGDIELLRYGTLDFESDELGKLSFDFADIVVLRSPRVNSCRFEGDITVVGTLLIRGDEVLVGGAKGQKFKRSDIVTIIPGELEELNYWSGKLGFSYAAISGNTDQMNIDGNVNIERRTLDTKLALDYRMAYGKLDGDDNIDYKRFLGGFNVFLTDRLYLTPVALEAYKDKFINIDYRLVPATGAGYYIYDRGDLEWNVDGLFGYQYVKYKSVPPGEDKSDSSASLIGRTSLEADVYKDIDFELDYSVTYGLSSDASTNHHTETGLSVELNDILDLKVTFIWDRVGSPERDANGELPDKNDFRTTVGLEIEF
ncbi:MAG: DUF481 domain-containing protein [Planctomycetota bacterium]|jgi:putative salt-induced outer membrane protein YdiY